MSEKTHYRKLINPEYLGAYSIDDDRDLILTIKSISSEEVVGTGGKKETCPVMRWVEREKPMIVNATNFKTLRRLFNSPYVEDWYGKKIALYADRNVRFGGETVEGLRIRDKQPRTDRFCADCKKVIGPYGKFSPAEIAQASAAKHGRELCAACAVAANEKAKQEAVSGTEQI